MHDDAGGGLEFVSAYEYGKWLEWKCCFSLSSTVEYPKHARRSWWIDARVL